MPTLTVDLVLVNDPSRVAAVGAQLEQNGRDLIRAMNRRWLQGDLPYAVEFRVARQIAFAPANVPFSIPSSGGVVNASGLLANFTQWFDTQQEAGQALGIYLTTDSFGGSIGLSAVGGVCSPNFTSVIHTTSKA